VPFVDLSSQVNSADDAALKDIALAKLKRKLAASTKSAQALVPLAELRELHGLVRGTERAAVDIIKTLLTIKQTKGRSVAKYASNAWLTWSFGIKPMIADTKAIVESIGEYLTRNDFNIRLTGSAKKSWFSSVKQPGTTGIYGGKLIWSAQLKHELSYRYIAGFDVNWKSGNNYTVYDQLNISSEALPSVAWELIPYSWVVDYFTTVGAYLEDTFSSNASTTKFVVLNKRYTMSGNLNGGLAPELSQVVNSTCRPGMVDYFSLTRTSLGAQLPTRQLRFKSFDEIGVNGVNRLLNLASLLVR
jgi:membrane-bound inhibitor of C-type lysozyme